MVCAGVPTGTDARPGWCLADPDTDTQSPKKPEGVGCTNLAGQLPWLPSEELCRAQNVQPGSAALKDRPVEPGRGPAATPLDRHFCLPADPGAARAERMLAPLCNSCRAGGRGQALLFLPQITSVFSILDAMLKRPSLQRPGPEAGVRAAGGGGAGFLCKKLQLCFKFQFNFLWESNCFTIFYWFLLSNEAIYTVYVFPLGPLSHPTPGLELI